MNLRAKVRLASLLPTAFALIIGALLWLSWMEVDQARQAAVQADRIRNGVADLTSLVQEFLLFDSPRAVRQLQSNQARLGGIVDAASFASPTADTVRRDIRRGLRELASLVDLLLQGGVGSREQIAGALLVKAHDVRSRARELDRAEQQRVVAFQRRVDRWILLALVLLAAASGGLLYLMGRRLVQGLDQLAAGIRSVESGDMRRPVVVTGDDEFATLGLAFNDMARQLRESYTSIEHLEREMAGRRQAESDRQDSEQRFRRLFHEAPVAMCFVDRDGVMADRNARFVQVFGYTEADVATLDEWWSRAYPDPAYRARVQETWGRAVEDAQTAGTDIEGREYRVTGKDGGERHMLVSGITLGDDLLASFFDLSDLKRAEREVRDLNANLERRVAQRTAELSAANRELDSFAYAVSHDLRAPLRAMSGFSQALQEDYGERLDGEARTYLDQIDIASRRMSELVDGILVLSRSTRGELRRELVDVSALSIRLLDEQARGDPDRKVATEVEPGLVTTGDPAMIEVVIANLLGNAWKYTGRVPEPCIRVYTEARDGRNWLCVADNGAGFDMAHAERLFQPFQRLHRQEEFVGIGIGLATVQRIVHRHGGHLEATGQPDHGATFCFTLPDARGVPQHQQRSET